MHLQAAAARETEANMLVSRAREISAKAEEERALVGQSAEWIRAERERLDVERNQVRVLF